MSLTVAEVIAKVNAAGDSVAGREMQMGDHHEIPNMMGALPIALHGAMPVADVVQLVELMVANALVVMQREGFRTEIMLGLCAQSVLAGIFIGLESCPP